MIKTHEEAVINFTADREELIRESRQNEAYGEEIMTIIKSKCPSILGTDNKIFHLNSKIENIFYLINSFGVSVIMMTQTTRHDIQRPVYHTLSII